MTPSRDSTMADERLDSLERRMDDVEKWQKEAVPGGDHHGHCRYHAGLIQRKEERRRLGQAVLEKTVSGLVWGSLLVLGLALWDYLVKKIKGG